MQTNSCTFFGPNLFRSFDIRDKILSEAKLSLPTENALPMSTETFFLLFYKKLNQYFVRIRTSFSVNKCSSDKNPKVYLLLPLLQKRINKGRLDLYFQKKFDSKKQPNSANKIWQYQ